MEDSVMFRSSFVVPVMLSLGVAVFAADFADAQILGRGRRGNNNWYDSSWDYDRGYTIDQRVSDQYSGFQDMQSYPRESFYFAPNMQGVDGQQIPQDSASIRVI